MTYKQWLMGGLKRAFSKETLTHPFWEFLVLTFILTIGIIYLAAAFSMWLLLLWVMPLFTFTHGCYRADQLDKAKKVNNK